MYLQKIIERFLDTEAYGFNLILKKYSGFPIILPLPSHLEHGWTPFENALITDINIAKEKKSMLVFSNRRKKTWKNACNVSVEIMGAPFLHYKKMMNIKKKSAAKGTIAFPSHSTLFLESNYNIDKYCHKLKSLPSEFHPITICLLYPDIKKGADKAYIKNGFEVVSAGKKLRGSLSFVKNFYNILSTHKYATSNEIGTYTFYSIDMGIPFFLFGDEPTILNTKGKDINAINKKSKSSDEKYGKIAKDLFNTGPKKNISQEQQRFVIDELGVNNCLSSKELKQFLLNKTKSINYWLRVPVFWIMSFMTKVIPMEFSYWMINRFSK